MANIAVPALSGIGQERQPGPVDRSVAKFAQTVNFLRSREYY
jgi:hypothetical protein